MALRDRRLQLVVLDHDKLDAHRSLEANLIQCMQIGRIGDGQKQAFAALHQGQNAMFLHELFAHRADGVLSVATASKSSNGTPNSFEAEMAISRARGQIRRHQMGDQD